MAASVIHLDRLTKRYGALTAVDQVSFDIGRGEVFAFLGQNGAGKTTTVEMLTGLRRPSSGAATVAGFDVVRDARKLKEVMGVLPQDFNTFERLTVRENLRYFARMYDRAHDVDDLLQVVGLADRASTRYGALSGGLKRRLGVATALVNDPEAVFLDEPTTGLDPAARRELWATVRDLRRRSRTVFLTTHYLDEAEALADRVGIIHRGRIVEIGDVRHILAASRVTGSATITGISRAAAARMTKRLGAGVHDAPTGTLVVPLSDDTRVEEVVDAIRAAKVRYRGLDVHKATLEDAFLALTGERLDEAEAAPQEAPP